MDWPYIVDPPYRQAHPEVLLESQRRCACLLVAVELLAKPKTVQMEAIGCGWNVGWVKVPYRVATDVEEAVCDEYPDLASPLNIHD